MQQRLRRWDREHKLLLYFQSGMKSSFHSGIGSLSLFRLFFSLTNQRTMEVEPPDPRNNQRRGREGEGGEGEQRNVRQRHNPRNENQDVVPRTEPFLERVPLEVQNLILRTAQGVESLPTRFEPRSLQSLIQEGSQQGTVMIAYIVGITASSSTQIQQRSYGQSRGAVSTARHARAFRFMCVLSDPGSNTFVIFEGGGNCPRLLSILDTRDNGDIRECFSFLFGPALLCSLTRFCRRS